MNAAGFRALFPALERIAWLDTPAAPPGARPVTDALRGLADDWGSGEFDWRAWDGAAGQTRAGFAALVGADASDVATVGSLAEAAATVARSIPRTRVVLAAEDFRSALSPWLALHDVVLVPPRDGATRVEDLAAALDTRTGLLAVSEVTTRDGNRLDLAALRQAADHVGARLFVNLTQSLGALRFDAAAVRPDFLAAHGYKWLLCPRGAAWLFARHGLVNELTPLAPNWRSGPEPYELFGVPNRLAATAARCDTSPAWFSWIGATVALRLMNSLDPAVVERHCLDLAAELVDEATLLGYAPVASVAPAQIVVLRADNATRVAAELQAQNVRASAQNGRVRFGVHYFNTQSDIHRALRALRATG